MGKETKIPWTDSSANLWWGCQEVHEGCDHCYARAWDRRHGGAHWGAAGYARRRPIKSVWQDLAKWQQQAAAAGRTARVFVGSMMDIFERSVALDDLPAGYSLGPFGEPGDDLRNVTTTRLLRHLFFERVVPASPNLEFLCLTKRPQNIERMVPDAWLRRWPANVMIGCSCVTQATVARDIAALVAVAGGPRRFVSLEPLLEAVDIGRWLPQLDWVIVGGESGPQARPFDPAWAAQVVAQCAEAGVPCFVKQMGSAWARAHGSIDAKGGQMDEWPENLRVREFPQAQALVEV